MSELTSQLRTTCVFCMPCKHCRHLEMQAADEIEMLRHYEQQCEQASEMLTDHAGFGVGLLQVVPGVEAVLAELADAKAAAQYCFRSARADGVPMAYEEQRWPWLAEKETSDG